VPKIVLIDEVLTKILQKYNGAVFASRGVMRLYFSPRQNTIHRHPLSLHGLSADQKFEVRTPGRPAADQQLAIFSRRLPATRGRSWLHAGDDWNGLAVAAFAMSVTKGWQDEMSRFLLLWPWPWPD